MTETKTGFLQGLGGGGSVRSEPQNWLGGERPKVEGMCVQEGC